MNDFQVVKVKQQLRGELYNMPDAKLTELAQQLVKATEWGMPYAENGDMFADHIRLRKVGYIVTGIFENNILEDKLIYPDELEGVLEARKNGNIHIGSYSPVYREIGD